MVRGVAAAVGVVVVLVGWCVGASASGGGRSSHRSSGRLRMRVAIIPSLMLPYQ